MPLRHENSLVESAESTAFCHFKSALYVSFGTLQNSVQGKNSEIMAILHQSTAFTETPLKVSLKEYMALLEDSTNQEFLYKMHLIQKKIDEEIENYISKEEQISFLIEFFKKFFDPQFLSIYFIF